MVTLFTRATPGTPASLNINFTKILEVNLFAFAYRLFRRDFSPLDGTYCMGTICPVEWGEISTKQSVGKCKQINF